MIHNCPKCSKAFEAPDNAPSVACPYCGNVTTAQQQQQYQQPYGQPQYAYGNQQVPPASDIGVFDVGPSGKSRGVAGLLAILLGYLGVHYFYLGKVGGGFICILLTLITCGCWSIITLIQGIMMMGMRSDEFERKYVTSLSTFPVF